MNRNAVSVALFAAASIALGGCGSLSSFSLPSLPGSAPSPTALTLESVPAGAEARLSTGDTCQTPCQLPVVAEDFTVTFSQPGFQSQTVPVRMTPSTQAPDPFTGSVSAARLAPNPVYVELQPGGAPTARRGSRPRPTGGAGAPATPRPAAAAPAPTRSASVPRPAATPRPAVARSAPASRPAPPPAPEPAPAGAWPPVTR